MSRFHLGVSAVATTKPRLYTLVYLIMFSLIECVIMIVLHGNLCDCAHLLRCGARRRVFNYICLFHVERFQRHHIACKCITTVFY